jgi:hypothetical protein
MGEQNLIPSTSERIFISGYMLKAEQMLACLDTAFFFRWAHQPLAEVYQSVLCCYDVDYDVTFLHMYLDLLQGCYGRSQEIGMMFQSRWEQISSGEQVPPGGEILKRRADSLDELRNYSCRLLVGVGETAERDNPRLNRLYSDVAGLVFRLSQAHSRSKSSLEKFALSQS